MLYSIILPIPTPYSAIDSWASDRWNFIGAILLKVKACVLGNVESITKTVDIVNTSILAQFSL